MLITKPTSKRYVFHYLNNSQYTNYARGYSLGKRNGARGIYLWATGMEVWGIVREAATDGVKRYGKKKFAICRRLRIGSCCSSSYEFKLNY